MENVNQSIAENIKENASSWYVALHWASQIAVEENQDWENGISTFTFEDDSRLVFDDSLELRVL